MKHTKVSLYVREHGTRRYNKVPDPNRPNYPSTTSYVLRYGSTWETLTVDNLSDATAKRIERELELLRGWRPSAKPKPSSALAELRRTFEFAVQTVGFTRNVVTSMGGIRVLPDLPISEFQPHLTSILILPGGDAWMREEIEEVTGLTKSLTEAGKPVAANLRGDAVFGTRGASR